MALLTCTDTCTAGVQLKSYLCHVYSSLYCRSSHLLCLPAPPTHPPPHPHMATPNVLCFSHLIPYSLAMLRISMPVATGYTCTDLKALELTHAAPQEVKLKALIMNCIHFIDVVQQLLVAGIRSTKKWQWQKQLRWECACTHTHTYICVYVLIA